MKKILKNKKIIIANIFLIFLALAFYFYSQKQEEKRELANKVEMNNFDAGLDYYDSAYNQYFNEDQPETALTYINKTIEILPKDLSKEKILKPFAYALSDAYSLRGMIHQDLGEYELAIEDHTNQININANNPRLISAYNDRATAKINLENFDSAINDLNKSLELDSTYCLTYEKLVEAKIKAGKVESGCLDFDTAKNLNCKIIFAEIQNICE